MPFTFSSDDRTSKVRNSGNCRSVNGEFRPPGEAGASGWHGPRGICGGHTAQPAAPPPPAPSAPGPSPPKFMPQAACRQPPPHLSAPARRALLLTPRPVPSSLCLVLPVPGTPRPSSTSPAHRSRPFFISNLREASVFCESLPYSFRL